MSKNVLTSATKTVVVTGGTGGIGFETAKGLASKGWRVIVTGRNESRAQETVRALEQAGAAEAIGLTADLSMQSEVVRLAREIASLAPRLDVLLNNAGALVGEEHITADGVELAIAVNHVAPWLLTNALLPSLEAAGQARVVIVSSSAHQFAKFQPGKIRARTPYVGLANYGDAKLLNLLTMFGWAHELKVRGISVLAADPGGAATDMTDAMSSKYLPWFMKPLWPVMKIMFGNQDPETSRRKAAVSSIEAASAAGFDGKTALFIGTKGKEASPSKTARDTANQAEALRKTRTAFDPAKIITDLKTDQAK